MGVYGQEVTVPSVQDAVDAVANLVATTTTRLRSLQASIRTTIGTAGEAVVVVDATLTSGTKCGPQTITDWTENLDNYIASGANALSTTNTFTPTTGTFVPPINGWYRVCGFFRFKKGGNANDV